MDAGRLDRRFSFFRRVEREDGAGNTVAEYVLQFSQAGNRKWQRGGETVLAARLESRQPVILTIRKSVQAGAVNSDWRVVDDRDGTIYNVRENPRASDDRGYFEFLAESGVAA